MTLAARALGFVAINVALVAAYLTWLVGVLPPLAGEGVELVVLPVSVIAAVAFAGMYPLLRRSETHLGRLVVLGLFVVVGIAAFTGFVLARLGAPEPSLGSTVGFGVIVVLAQLPYGAPLFVGVAALNKLLSRFLLARPVRAWA
jgi:hypothetical protein